MSFLLDVFKHWAVVQAYRQGKQDAYKDAARHARLRSDLILESAPRGRLRDGLMLAALASSLASDYDNKRRKGD